MQQSIAPAVDPMQRMVFSPGYRPGVFPQQHAFVEGMAMGLRQADQIIHTGRRLHLVVQSLIAGHRMDKGLKRSHGHRI